MQSWAQQEVGQAHLGHAARTKRLVQVVQDLAAHPAESVPQACEDWAATKGAYRFWDNKQVSAQAIRAAHQQSTVGRCQGQELILAIQDTTDVDYSTHPKTTGLAACRRERSRGLASCSASSHVIHGTSRGRERNTITCRTPSVMMR